MNSAILNFHIKSFADMQQSAKTTKLFCLETFMVYSILVTIILKFAAYLYVASECLQEHKQMSIYYLQRLVYNI